MALVDAALNGKNHLVVALGSMGKLVRVVKETLSRST